ncbi:hypothetical protein [Roseateles flavus]|uniref:Uncharacterized protein n=1 Tax=Roseateles flavus TaxID=3149041 RepID=A0ABV0GJ91_9BURK
MNIDKQRGSEKLLAAWKARQLTEESVREIAQAMDKSPARIEEATVYGGANATGMRLSLSYAGDDVPMCGNDLLFWLKWHRTHGGEVKPPRILIDGTPWPDLIRMQLDFGHVVQPANVLEGGISQLGARGALGG